MAAVSRAGDGLRGGSHWQNTTEPVAALEREELSSQRHRLGVAKACLGSWSCENDMAEAGAVHGMAAARQYSGEARFRRFLSSN
jgi:hypothetical protein